MVTQILALVVFPGLLSWAAATDLLTMTIPNRISLALVACFFPMALVSGMPFVDIASHSSAGLAMLLFCFCLFSFGLLGGGDAKLVAAVALWFGWMPLAPFVVYTALFGGAMSLIIISARRMPLPATLERVPWITRLHSSGEGIPYGLAIAAGAFIAYPETYWMTLAG